MKHIVSFSGGRTSAYLSFLMVEKSRNEGLDVDFIFCDTGAEDPRTYDFIRKVNKEFDLNLTCLRGVIVPVKGIGVKYEVVSIDEIKPDLKPFRQMVVKYGVPYYPMGRQCTNAMKTEPFTKYCNDKYGKGNYKKWLGIRADEPRRLKPKDGVGYLADISDFEKPDVIEWWSRQSFDLETPEWLNNCMFCIQKKVSKVALALRDQPDYGQSFINMVEDHASRHKGKQYDAMYEHNMSLKQIRSSWADYGRDQILESVIRGKRLDTGSCSESCEPFQTDDDISSEYES